MNVRNKIIDSIIFGKPISFCKFGDGEYYCMIGNSGANCDKDAYTSKLSDSLKQSLIKFSYNENCYIGMWVNKEVVNYFNSLTNDMINYACYHTFILSNGAINTCEGAEILNVFKTIKHAKQKKIYICNYLMVRSKGLLNIDYLVHAPLNNWFDSHFDTIVEEVVELTNSESNPIIMTSCGMGAKVLISRLLELIPNGIYLDIGSGLDFLCTKKESRGFINTYDEVETLFKDLLPEDWNDEKYNTIFELAKIKLGTHL